MDVDGGGLPHAVDARDGLLFDGGFDLGFTDDDLTGALDVQPHTSRGDLRDEGGSGGGVGEGVDKLLASGGWHAAVDPAGDTLPQDMLEFVEDVEEEGEDQGFAAMFLGFVEQLDDALHLG